ncbi:MAG: hypothetical protein ACXW3U_17635, partial [Rhodoplanes sp.]
SAPRPSCVPRCSTPRHGIGDKGVTALEVDLDVLTPAERRDLANALLRAAWSATLQETRILLLDLLLEVDGAIASGTP